MCHHEEKNIEVISTKTVSRSQEINNEGQIVKVLRHIMNVKRKYVEHKVTESHRYKKRILVKSLYVVAIFQIVRKENKHWKVISCHLFWI